MLSDLKWIDASLLIRISVQSGSEEGNRLQTNPRSQKKHSDPLCPWPKIKRVRQYLQGNEPWDNLHVFLELPKSDPAVCKPAHGTAQFFHLQEKQADRKIRVQTQPDCEGS